GNTHTTNHALAQAINNLTLQYLYTLAGKPNPANSTSSPGDDTRGEWSQWIQPAQKILQQYGINLGPSDLAALRTIIQHESDGNPNAVNNEDVNAVEGHPSKGLMQTIDSTFEEYAVPGHTDIWNPVDNIVAGVRYAVATYGSLPNVRGLVAMRNGQPYVGY
ncbi:transglycosylase SLT domain-containing protein, partial [Nocardia sp. CDC160]|uniref:transglycosylase SLT domain-containing protein n=1 Tax=Nocardia sp. CDC160 TaxID=3112166 RepID=UPI002DB9BECB